MFNQPASNSANSNGLSIQQNSAGDAVIQTTAAGTATRANLTLDAPVVTVTGAVGAATVQATQNGGGPMLWANAATSAVSMQGNPGGAWTWGWDKVSGRLFWNGGSGTSIFSIDNAGGVGMNGGLIAGAAVEAGTNGSYNMKMSGGVGGTKYMRCNNNAFEIVNSAFSAVIFGVNDAGRVEPGVGFASKAGTSGGTSVNNWNWYWNSDNHLWGYVDTTAQCHSVPTSA